MNAARRPAFAAALLCGLAACSPDSGDRQPSASAEAAARAASAAASIARDAALSDALIGAWAETNTRSDGVARRSVVHYAADRTFTAVVTRIDKPDDRHTAAGTWSIAQGFLTYRWRLDGGAEEHQGSDEILRIDAGQFAYVGGEDKGTKIAVRVQPEALAAATPTPQLAAAPASALAASPAPVSAEPPEDAPFADETIFVAKDDVGAHYVRVVETAQIRLVVEIEEKVPVNVVFQRGRVAPEEYLMGLGVLTLGQVFAMFDDGKGEKVSTIDDLFKNRLSKRAAYGRFASPWVTLKAGTYTVILDNSGEVSSSLGHAPVRLRLYSRPAP